MKEIELSQGQVAIVDDEDFEYLSQWKWCARRFSKTFYASRGDYTVFPKRFIAMHRLITGALKGQQVDHINHNGIDNRRENLRVCTRTQNARNRDGWRQSSSKYKGVHFNTCPRVKRTWRAAVGYQGKLYRLGSYFCEESAALAYNIVAKRLFGEFAKLNVIL